MKTKLYHITFFLAYLEVEGVLRDTFFVNQRNHLLKIREKMSGDEVYTLQESTWCPPPPLASSWGKVSPSQEPAPQHQFSFTGTEYNYRVEDTGNKLILKGQCPEIFCFRFLS